MYGYTDLITGFISRLHASVGVIRIVTMILELLVSLSLDRMLDLGHLISLNVELGF